MNKVFKTILISLIAIFSIGLLFIEPVQAQPIGNFVVQFENEPPLSLFDEANFLPGDNVIRWIKITNNTVNPLKIVTKATNIIDNEGLGGVLNLEIKNGSTSFYNDALSHFFSAGGLSLPNLATGGVPIQYDYIISFDSVSGNEYQNKHLGFDISITGYDDSTSIQQTYTSGGGGGGTTTVSTEPSRVKGITTESEPLEEVIGQGGSVLGGAQNTNNVTTTTIPGLILGAATEQEPSSCKSKLLSLGINPFLASSFCLGENTCSTCLKPWWVLLLGLAITFGCAILAKKHHEKYD
ncbi:MAG: hypothetical protein NTX26_02650 [Candidatus Parcubacteria bacterium]|nr:hypothetical protein [Candidatus Parcubacteria bacterium]